MYYCNEGHEPEAKTAGGQIDCPYCSRPMKDIGWYEEVAGLQKELDQVKEELEEVGKQMKDLDPKTR